MTGRGRRGQEVRGDAGQDRQRKAVGWHLQERGALQVAADPDRVERDIDPACLLHDRSEMLLDGLLIEGIDLRRHGGSARDGYLLGHGFDLCQGAARKEDVRPFTRKGTGNCTADMAACPKDDGVLVLEQYRFSSLVRYGCG